jgi:hypothetical protein
MALLVANAAEGLMIDAIVNATTSGSRQNMNLRLFKNNQTPTSTMLIADYTESTFTGYAAVATSSGGWTITTGAPTTATQTAATTFTCTATTNESTYGYYLTGTGDGLLRWAERFSDGPYTIANNGDKVILTASITLSTT